MRKRRISLDVDEVAYAKLLLLKNQLGAKDYAGVISMGLYLMELIHLDKRYENHKVFLVDEDGNPDVEIYFDSSSSS